MSAPFSLGFGIRYSEAIAAAEARKVTLPDAFYGEVPEQLRQYAFTVSGLTGLEQVQAVLDSLNARVREGKSFQDWKREALEQDWGIPRNRLELIARNHSQTAYMAGHWKRFHANVQNRPFLMYSAVNDSRTRPAHRAMSGQIAPVDDSLWLTWSPPCGHNCRCTLISLTADQAKLRGAGQQQRPNVQADAGWGHPPAEAADRMRQQLDQRAREAGPPFVSAIDRIMQGGYTFPPLEDEERGFAVLLREDLHARFGDRYDALTDAEIWAFHQYATDSFPINAFMRGLMDASVETKRDIISVQQALLRLGDRVERITFRGGMSDPKFDRVAARAFQVGNVIENSAFLSSSSEELAAAEFSDKYVITIRGTSGVNIDGFYPLEAESEYLYPAGTRFRVMKVNRVAEVTFVELIETHEAATYAFSA
jgi:SPP1 gp7 family putative phage head morphogenesis protein